MSSSSIANGLLILNYRGFSPETLSVPHDCAHDSTLVLVTPFVRVSSAEPSPLWQLAPPHEAIS